MALPRPAPPTRRARPRWRAAALAGLIMGPLFGLMAGPATAADETAVTYFRIGTGSLSGTDCPVGETIANLISKPPGSAP